MTVAFGWTFYVIGFPLFLICFLFLRKYTRDALLADQARAIPELKPYGFLFEHYRPGVAPWFEVFELLRRLTLTGLISFMGPLDGASDYYVAARASAGMVISLALALVYRELLPYRNRFLNALCTMSMYLILFAYCFAFIIDVRPWGPMSDWQLGVIGWTLMLCALPVSAVAALRMIWEIRAHARLERKKRWVEDTLAEEMRQEIENLSAEQKRKLKEFENSTLNIVCVSKALDASQKQWFVDHPSAPLPHDDDLNELAATVLQDYSRRQRRFSEGKLGELGRSPGWDNSARLEKHLAMMGSSSSEELHSWPALDPNPAPLRPALVCSCLASSRLVSSRLVSNEDHGSSSCEARNPFEEEGADLAGRSARHPVRRPSMDKGSLASSGDGAQARGALASSPPSGSPRKARKNSKSMPASSPLPTPSLSVIKRCLSDDLEKGGTAESDGGLVNDAVSSITSSWRGADPSGAGAGKAMPQKAMPVDAAAAAKEQLEVSLPSDLAGAGEPILLLAVDALVQVQQKRPDGWWYGFVLPPTTPTGRQDGAKDRAVDLEHRDGGSGWFPSSYVGSASPQRMRELQMGFFRNPEVEAQLSAKEAELVKQKLANEQALKAREVARGSEARTRLGSNPRSVSAHISLAVCCAPHMVRLSLSLSLSTLLAFSSPNRCRPTWPSRGWRTSARSRRSGRAW